MIIVSIISLSIIIIITTNTWSLCALHAPVTCLYTKHNTALDCNDSKLTSGQIFSYRIQVLVRYKYLKITKVLYSWLAERNFELFEDKSLFQNLIKTREDLLEDFFNGLG